MTRCAYADKCVIGEARSTDPFIPILLANVCEDIACSWSITLAWCEQPANLIEVSFYSRQGFTTRRIGTCVQFFKHHSAQP